MKSKRTYLLKIVVFAVIVLISFHVFSCRQGNEKKIKNPQIREKITAARYAPDGMYMKDHYLIYHKGKWHLFAPPGKIGTMWHCKDSEESSELMISSDLLNWEYAGTAVAASRKEGHFDRLMGGIAPCVIKQKAGFT